MEAGRVKKAYLKLLLAFEQHLSQDCKVEVRKVSPTPYAKQHKQAFCIFPLFTVNNAGKMAVDSLSSHTLGRVLVINPFWW